MMYSEERRREVNSSIEKRGIEWDEVVQIVKSEGSKSSKMVKLYELGVEVNEVCVLLGVRYNFVYNVISGKFGSIRKVKKESMSEKFIEKFEEGMKVSEVSKLFNVNYNWVYSINRKWKKTKEEEKASK